MRAAAPCRAGTARSRRRSPPPPPAMPPTGAARSAVAGAAAFRSGPSRPTGYRRPVPQIPVLDHDAVLRAVSPLEAIERVREGFLEYAAGDWEMPPKVYLDAAPHGDFRAMPAKGAGL